MKHLEAYCSLYCASDPLKSGISFLEAGKPPLQFWPLLKPIILSHPVQTLDGEVIDGELVAGEERADPLQGPCNYFGLVRSRGPSNGAITSDGQRG